MMIVAMPGSGKVPCRTQRGESAPALSFEVVQELIDGFRPLSLFDPTLVDAVWRVEHQSLTNPLWVYAISAKRYCLFRYDEHGQPVLVDWSEHGLGLYLDPTDPENPRRDEQGRRIWLKEAWDWIVREALGLDAQMPAMMRATGLSSAYCWKIRKGERTPHPMYWKVLQALVASGKVGWT